MSSLSSQRRPASRPSYQTLIPPALPKGLVGLCSLDSLATPNNGHPSGRLPISTGHSSSENAFDQRCLDVASRLRQNRILNCGQSRKGAELRVITWMISGRSCGCTVIREHYGRRSGHFWKNGVGRLQWSEHVDRSREILAAVRLHRAALCYIKTAAPSIVARDLRSLFEFSCIS